MTYRILSPLLFILCFLLVACGKNQETPASLSPQEASKAMNSAFEKADPKIKAEVTQILSEVDKKNDVQAFLQLQELASRPELAPEQRSVVSSALLGTGQRLQSAADAGNAQAQEMLKLHRASK